MSTNNNNDDTEEEVNREKPATPTRKRRMRNELSKEEKVEAKHQKTYQAKWEEMPEFKSWVKPVKGDPSKAFCSVCGTAITCGKSELQKHAMGKTHLKQLKTVKSCQSVTKAFLEVPAKIAFQKDVKTAEIGLSAVFAEHNIAMQTVDHLLPTLKGIFKDSKIAQSMCLGRTKCAEIIKNVISKVETEEIVETLKEVPFSVMMDGSSDITLHKTLCVLVRYVCPKTGDLRTQLLELIELNAVDCSAEALYTAFKDCLATHEIPLQNIVGYGCDNENVMTGRRNSVWSRLQEDAPAAVLIGCNCHAAALSASKACEELPCYLDEFISKITGYIDRSPKRQANLEDFQAFFGVELHKILKMAKTRWLCRQQCVSRVLEQWTVLEHFFTVATADETESGSKSKPATKILEDFCNPMTKAYLLFLKYALNYFNTFNAMLQTNKVIIHQLKDRSIRLVKEMAQNFVKPECLENFDGFNELDNLLSPEEVYLGPSCEEYLKLIASEEDQDLWRDSGDPDDPDTPRNKQAISEVRKNCMNFYRAATDDLLERLGSIRDPIFEEMKFLDPAVALSATCEFRHEHRELCLLPARYKDTAKLDLEALAVEWRTMPFALNNADKERIIKMEPDKAWIAIGAIKTLDGTVCFPEMCKLARCVLALPHANSDAERIFSVVTDVRSKKRNRIGGECLNAICVARSAFQAKKTDCTTFKVSDRHLSLHNTSMYSHTT